MVTTDVTPQLKVPPEHPRLGQKYESRPGGGACFVVGFAKLLDGKEAVLTRDVGDYGGDWQTVEDWREEFVHKNYVCAPMTLDEILRRDRAERGIVKVEREEQQQFRVVDVETDSFFSRRMDNRDTRIFTYHDISDYDHSKVVPDALFWEVQAYEDNTAGQRVWCSRLIFEELPAQP